MKKKTVKLKENEKDDKMMKQDEADPAAHDDAAQDVALIKKMIGEYMGDGSKDMSKEEMEALHELGSEAYAAHREMGAKEDEAYQHAGQALKLAHHMSKKKMDKAEASDDKAMPDKKDDAKKKDVPDDDDKGAAVEDECKKEAKEDESEGESKESNALKKKLIVAEGRIAALEAQTKKETVAKLVDKVLKESGQPSSVTKRFLSIAGDIKSKEDFEAKWTLFQEGAKNSMAKIDWNVLQEKSVTREDGGKGGSAGLDFSKCAE